MWRHVQTLRFKLAGLYLLVFGTILITVCYVLLDWTQTRLRADFDQRLQDAASTMFDKIEINSERSDLTSGNPLELVNPFRFPGYYFELRYENGQQAYRSSNLGQLELPWGPELAAAKNSESPIIITFSGDAAEKLIRNKAEVRLLTLYKELRPADGPSTPFYLQVAVNLRSVNEQMAALTRQFVSLIAGALLAGAVASWFVSKRSLEPIEKIRKIADQLSVQDMHQRFEQPRGRDEVAMMVETINRMLDRLHDAFQAQERFIAHASHELKTPLSVLLGEAQVIMQKHRSPEEYERFVASVQEEVRSLAQMIDSVLTLARAEAGLPITTADEVSLNEVVIEAVEGCQPLAKQREVRLVPHLMMPTGDEAPPVINGDGDLIRLLFVNLIRNAIRYTPVDQAVDISVAVGGPMATISVRDNGPGIPPEFIDRVFDRFFRVPEKVGGFKGVGLGLTIVRGIAQLHGGTAVATNRPTGGCEFIVRLPLAGKNPRMALKTSWQGD